jgi:hypothetical protein
MEYYTMSFTKIHRKILEFIFSNVNSTKFIKLLGKLDKFSKLEKLEKRLLALSCFNFDESLP